MHKRTFSCLTKLSEFLISSIEATSNWLIPLFNNVLIQLGCGFVLTAYKILPGNLF